jgi:protein SCO1
MILNVILSAAKDLLFGGEKQILRRFAPQDDIFRIALVIGSILTVVTSPAVAHLAHPEQLRWEQHPGASVPLDLRFADERAPVVLVLGYLRCPNLCDTTLAGVTEGLRMAGLRPGSDYRALFVSIDPRDTPALAAEAKAKRVPADARGAWRFVTSDAAIDTAAIARAVGFRYTRDGDEYAHPAGFVVLTPAGAVSRYFPGVRFDPGEVRVALADARRGESGPLARPLLLLCAHIDPSGRYTAAIIDALRAAALLFLAGGALFVWRAGRRKASP